MNNNIEELITALYDMIQDAKGMPLNADKCIVERDKALDMLDEISAMMPGEFKQAAAIVQSRDELIAQARRESENIIRNARAEAAELVKQEAIYQEARKRCEEMVQQTQVRIQELKKVSNDYMANSLMQTEEAMLKALNEVRVTRTKFQTVTDSAASIEVATPVPATAERSQFDQEI